MSVDYLMPMSFAPNNNDASRLLYTGRTTDLEHIIGLILKGRCVALYGERKSGKTLTLEMLQSIINGDILLIIDQLVDQKLKAKVPEWRTKLSTHKAIYISFHGKNSEPELIQAFWEEGQRIGIIQNQIVIVDAIPDPGIPARLGSLLDRLQTSCLAHNYRVVVLLDEMEVLGRFEQEGGPVAELFCDRKRYSNLLFVHTGSYLWRKRVASPGSLFSHLEPHYLSSSNSLDMKYFLLATFSQDIRSFIIENTGSKPIYTQYVGEILLNGPEIASADELLIDASLCIQISQNIFDEANLDLDSRQIILFLAHHPNSNLRQVAIKLGLNESLTRNRLTNLRNFGTISCENNKYKVTGKIIEKYGQDNYPDPSVTGSMAPPKSFWRVVAPYLQWGGMLIIIIFSIYLFSYYNPGTSLSEFTTENFIVYIENPKSLEEGENGSLSVAVFNVNKDMQNSNSPPKVILLSPSMRFDSGNGSNAISLGNIEINHTVNYSLEYHVLPVKTNPLIITTMMDNTSIGQVSIPCRPVPLKKWAGIITALLNLIAVIIPGKRWITLVEFAKQLISKPSSS